MKFIEKDFEPAGLIPRSIIRTIERFRQQLRPETIALGIQEFRISRYQVRVSVRYFFILLLLPITLNWGATNLFIKPLVSYFWNTYQTSLFLNNYQAERAFTEIRDYESQLFFEMLVLPENFKEKKNKEPVLDQENFKILKNNLKTSKKTNNQVSLELENFFNNSCSEIMEFNENGKPLNSFENSKNNNLKNQSLSSHSQNPILKNQGIPLMVSPSFPSITLRDDPLGQVQEIIKTDKGNFKLQKTDMCFSFLFQRKMILLGEIYNQQSINALSNMFGDSIMIISTILLIRFNRPQFIILKSFLIESFYSFNDAIKCFYIILVTDFLVGFHSPRGWEIVMELLLRHLGLPENEEFILLFVGTFPVFLDTAFKYWIFRYLNKISPSTVATYHNMIE